jgi:signal peptidase I
VSATKKKTSSSLLELVLIVATALALALGIQAFLVKPYRIPSESMVPTLDVGQRVLVNRIGTRFADPKARSDQNFIKRVVAGPRDRLRILDGHVILNGRQQKDGFTRPCGGGTGCSFPREITIPKGHYFMMGDNRGSSDDSRFWGPVPKKWIIGSAFATYWPPGRIGLL